jgi:hypothetical protein
LAVLSRLKAFLNCGIQASDLRAREDETDHSPMRLSARPSDVVKIVAWVVILPKYPGPFLRREAWPGLFAFQQETVRKRVDLGRTDKATGCCTERA